MIYPILSAALSKSPYLNLSTNLLSNLWILLGDVAGKAIKDLHPIELRE